MITGDKNTTVRRFAGDIVCCLVLLGLCLAVGIPRYKNGIGLGDEGFLAYGAVRVMEGQVPNRDFVSYQPPLSFYTVAAMFHAFGTSLATLRLLGLFIYLLIPLLVYALARRLAGRAVSLAAALPASVLGMQFFAFVPFAVWHGVLFSLLAALLIVTARQTGRLKWSFIAGLATALTLVSRHDQGVYMSAAIVVYALAARLSGTGKQDRQHTVKFLGCWFAGVMMLILPLGLLWSVSGAVPSMIHQLIVFPATTYAKTSSLPMPRFYVDRPLSYNVIAGLFYLPPVVQAVTAAVLLFAVIRRRFSSGHADAVFVLAFSALFYCQVLTRSDLFHMLITLCPFFVLCAWWMDKISDRLHSVISRAIRGRWDDCRISFVAVTATLLLAAGPGLWFFSLTRPVFLGPLKQPARTLSLERGGVEVNTRYASSLENIVTEIKRLARPDQSILCLPYQPMLYFLSDRRNPTRWNYIWPGDQTLQDHEALIRQAQSDPPALVLITGRLEMQNYAPAIMDYITGQYAVAFEGADFTLYLPPLPSPKSRHSSAS